MATAGLILPNGFTDSDQSENLLTYPTESGSGIPYKVSRLSYRDKNELDITFIIRCYEAIYERIGEVENRMAFLEMQNKEILSLLSKNIGSPVHFIGENFVEIDDAQMKEKIIGYYETHKVVYPSDIAFEFNFDLKKVVNIINELISSGKVEEVPQR
jgi:hypothetical protein